MEDGGVDKLLTMKLAELFIENGGGVQILGLAFNI